MDPGHYTLYLYREDAQVSELLLVVLGQQSQALRGIPGNVEGDAHAVPWLHPLWPQRFGAYEENGI